jgi:parvulin-like peptidyl-prolyl isomerase
MSRSLCFLAASLLLVASACQKDGASSSAASSATASTSAPVQAAASGVQPAASTSASATADAPPPDAIIAQHILVAYAKAKGAPKSVTRTKPQAKARAEEARAKVLSGTSFADVVKEYSDDEGSVDRMGSVGKFTREKMDPAFSAAAFSLKVGGVSEVVETPFGYHVIKRTQ